MKSRICVVCRPLSTPRWHAVLQRRTPAQHMRTTQYRPNLRVQDNIGVHLKIIPRIRAALKGVAILFGIISSGACLLHFVEQEPWLDSFYWALTTFSTVGAPRSAAWSYTCVPSRGRSAWHEHASALWRRSLHPVDARGSRNATGVFAHHTSHLKAQAAADTTPHHRDGKRDHSRFYPPASLVGRRRACSTKRTRASAVQGTATSCRTTPRRSLPPTSSAPSSPLPLSSASA